MGRGGGGGRGREKGGEVTTASGDQFILNILVKPSMSRIREGSCLRTKNWEEACVKCAVGHLLQGEHWFTVMVKGYEHDY